MAETRARLCASIVCTIRPARAAASGLGEGVSARAAALGLGVAAPGLGVAAPGVVVATARVAGLGVALFVAAPLLAGDPITVSRDGPVLDKWNYPFNQTVGTKPEMKIFGAFTSTGLSPDFDNRDGQGLFAFDTAASLPTCLPPSGYVILSATVTVQIESDLTFRYDPTLDAWQTYLHVDDAAHVPDADAGRPLELFGAAFRHGFTRLTYLENTPYSAVSTFGKFVRSAYPLAFDPAAGGASIDVSNSVDQQFDAAPFAIGTTTAVAPGALVPQLATFEFSIDVGDAAIQQYLGESLRDGRLFFAIASMFDASEQTGGTFPEIFTKENPAVGAGLAFAARLEMLVDVTGKPGDSDGNDVINVTDLLALLADWGGCTGCPSDTNCDGQVNVTDLLALLAAWG